MSMFDENLERKIELMAMKMYKELNKPSQCCKRVIKAGLEVDSRMLEDVLKSCRVVLLNFYSTMCPYCELYHPVFVSVGKKYEGKAAFVRMNAYANPEKAMEYGIMNLPSTVVFIDEKPRGLLEGFVKEDVLENVVEKVLKEAGC